MNLQVKAKIPASPLVIGALCSRGSRSAGTLCSRSSRSAGILCSRGGRSASSLCRLAVAAPAAAPAPARLLAAGLAGGRLGGRGLAVAARLGFWLCIKDSKGGNRAQ